MSNKIDSESLVKLPVLAGRVTFPLKRMAAAMVVTEDEMRAAMQDGRGAFPFSEHWGLMYIRYLDKIGKPVEGGQKSIDTFALTHNGIQFQRAKYKGSGRDGGIQELIDSILRTRIIMVVDVRSFPDVVFIPVRPHDLAETVQAGGLGVSGWAGNSFYKWARSRYAFTVKKVALTKVKETAKMGPVPKSG